MLVVKVEIWPFGNASKARLIARMDICNTGDHKERETMGNYVYELWDHEMAQYAKVGHVKNMPRGRDKVWPLVLRALKAALRPPSLDKTQKEVS